MERREGPWEVEDIVQVSPGHDERFGAALLVVSGVMSWGVKGYVVAPNSGSAYYRLPYKQEDGVTPAGVRVGTAHWLSESEEPKDGE